MVIPGAGGGLGHLAVQIASRGMGFRVIVSFFFRFLYGDNLDRWILNADICGYRVSIRVPKKTLSNLLAQKPSSTSTSIPETTKGRPSSQQMSKEQQHEAPVPQVSLSAQDQLRLMHKL